MENSRQHIHDSTHCHQPQPMYTEADLDVHFAVTMLEMVGEVLGHPAKKIGQEGVLILG